MNAPPVTRTFAVSLTIPDNEAFTAAQALRRLGVPVATVRRSNVYRLDVDAQAAESIEATLRGLEGIFNPNKHRMVERSGEPAAAEAWIGPREAAPLRTLDGRTLGGVSAVERFTAWELLDASGNPVEPAVLDRAVEMFLCNPAFQKAIRCRP